MTTRNTLVGRCEARQEIKKSRFMAIAAPITDEDAAKAFVADVSDPAANHNCWAWRLGQTYRFSDDGEPSGTAGKPILQAIDGQSLDGVVVVVTRWFGGILLGSGGLMRAYGGTAAICLREAEQIVLVETVSASVHCTFGDLALLQARLDTLPFVDLLAQHFTADGAVLAVAVHTHAFEEAGRLIADMTSGRSQLKQPDRQ